VTPERWQKIAACYHSALEREGDNRTAHLQQACAGDDALRQEVESLLALIGEVAAEVSLRCPHADCPSTRRSSQPMPR
jgi:hypothetical protein